MFDIVRNVWKICLGYICIEIVDFFIECVFNRCVNRLYKLVSVKIKRVNSLLLKWVCICVFIYGVSYFRGYDM